MAQVREGEKEVREGEKEVRKGEREKGGKKK